MAAEGNNIGGVVAAVAINPECAPLEYRAHQIEARGGTLIGALIKIGETEKRSQEERSLDPPIIQVAVRHIIAQAVQAASIRPRRDRTGTGGAKVVPNAHHPAAAQASKTRKTATSDQV